MTLTRKKPLRRTSTLRGSSAPLAKVSQKQSKVNSQKQKAYKVVKATEDPWCLACGSPHDLQPSHVLTQSGHKHLRAHPRNVVFLCVKCHPIWEDNKPEFARLYPAAFAVKMERMQELAPNYYVAFRGRYPHLFDAT